MRCSDLALLALLCACGGPDTSPDPDGREGTDTSDSTAVSTTDSGTEPVVACTDLDYETFGRSFLTRWCTSCHAAGLADGQRYGAPLGMDFDTYQGFLQHQQRALSATTSRSMPPGATVPTEEVAAFEEWVGCGSPGTEVDGPTPPDATSATADTSGSSTGYTGDTATAIPGSCPWEGTWSVERVACAGSLITDTWNATFLVSELTFRSTDELGACRVEVYRADADCGELQTWLVEPRDDGHELFFDEVESCDPAGCILGPSVCQERSLSTVSPLEVDEPEADRLIFSGIQGVPFCQGDIALELVR